VQTNYYFLRPLSASLSQKLEGWVLGACFSQEKDELVLGFWTEGQEFYVKTVMKPDLAALVFYENFNRAKQNSVNLFEELIGAKVINLIQFENERAFTLIFNEDRQLLFKLYGNRSNVIYFRKNEFIEMFQHKLVQDEKIQLQDLHRPLVQTFSAFAESDFNLNKIFPTFGKNIFQYIDSQRFYSQEERWTFVENVVRQLKTPVFYITLLKAEPKLSLLPIGEIQFQTDNPIEAANRFYAFYNREFIFEKEKQNFLNQWKKKKIQTENYLLKTYQKLEELQAESVNEQYANILMANLHLISADMDKTELFDFYHDKPVVIKLKKDIPPQKNAEIYYRKAKNSVIEIQKIKEAVTAKEKELQSIENKLIAIDKAENIKDLRRLVKETEGNRKEKKNQASDPDEIFKKYHFMGFDIWVGKNAKNNDLLTQKYAFKEDLWLHAKDVAGSHVIIRHQAGKSFPQPVIEKAAGLAAYFSKRRTDSLCPVSVTPKKFVRKTKDLAEGEVIVEKETVILVPPEAP
jgi:predicted ribosome quality control (RQC) complex YloA/Tae2 family protein